MFKDVIDGWKCGAVCLVTEEVVVDEAGPPQVPEDEFSSGLGLEDWLKLIEALYG